MEERQTGSKLVELTREGRYIEVLNQLEGRSDIEPIHIAAILGTARASEQMTKDVMDSYEGTLMRRIAPENRTALEEARADGMGELHDKLLEQKINGETWSAEDIGRIVTDMPDELTASLLGAIMVKDLKTEETAALTNTMWKSGDTIDFSEMKKEGYVFVDKHSTGGIGDCVSLVLAPLLAAAYDKLVVPMMSGRGLGHTGGTLDKLEAIPGLRTDLTPEEVKRNIKDIGATIFAQSENLAPADGKLYGLRDATNCVANIGLIIGSILSKKLSSGLDVLVMDTKTGSGAFLSQYNSAKDFAQQICDVGSANGLKMSALITDMNEPLAAYAGNKLEVIYAIEALSGMKEDSRFMDVVYELAGEIVDKVGLDKEKLREDGVLERAYDKFKDMVEVQGGEEDYVDQVRTCIVDINTGTPPCGLFCASEDEIRSILDDDSVQIYEVKAETDGYIEGIQLTELGEQIRALGAGRYKPGDKINPNVGMICGRELGDDIRKGDTLALIVYDGKRGDLQAFAKCFEIGSERPKINHLVYETVKAA